MNIKWKKRKHLNPQVILDKIEGIKNISEDGKVSYSAFEYHDAFASLYSMLDVPQKITKELNVESILSKGLRTAAESGAISKESVLESINRIVKSELATGTTKYRILTSLSISNPLPFKRLNFDSATIRFIGAQYPKKYDSRVELINSMHHPFTNEHKGYSKIIVSLQSKSVHGALSKALYELDTMRALLSIFCNSGMELFGSQHNPINKIRTGEVHTIHLENGSSINKMLWFEPNFIQSKVYKHPDQNVLKSNFNWCLEQLRRCPYKKSLSDALVRYVRSLDSKDYNASFVRLWGALESIAAPSDPRYDPIIKRCSFVLDEAKYHKQILEHLREYRNMNIHAGDEAEKVKTLCFQLQFYFRQLVLFHLKKSTEFSSLEQANRFLDLPDDADALLERSMLIKKALIFRGIETSP